MKTKCFYGMLLSAAVLLTACTEDMLDGRRGEVPITLTTTVLESHGPMVTRAGVDVQSTQLPSGTTFAAEFTGSDVTVNSATYTADGQGGATTATQPYFTLSGTSTTVYAYCPSKPSGTFSVAADQSSDADYRASDLLYATATICKLGTTNLPFAHKMAKIIVNATVGEGIGSITGVYLIGGCRTVNITDTTTCTLGDELSDAVSTSSPIIMWTGSQTTGTLSCAALLPPQTVTSSDFLKITTNQGDVIYNLDSKAFASGQTYTINTTVDAAAVDAAAVGSFIYITNWTDNGSVYVDPLTQYIFVAPGVPIGALPGKFTINDSGSQVYFSQGNLRATYKGSSWTWSFATNQWDYIGSYGANTRINGNGTITGTGSVDLFGWVGASSTWTGVNKYGITSSTTTNDTNGYGNSTSDALKADWGTLAISNGGNTTNSGWRTLTKDEWKYIFGTNDGDKRSGSTVNGTANARYAHATINTDVSSGVNGMILFPDGVTIAADEATTWGTLNGNSSWGTKCTSAEWSALAAKGCVFLPAAGDRIGTSVSSAGTYGYYWSSSPFTSNVAYAGNVYFYSSNLGPTGNGSRYGGFSVRLVYDVPSPYQASDVGKVICSKAHIHRTVNEATAAGCTASGIIAYVGDAGTADTSEGSGSYRGLALALYDYGGSLEANGTTCMWYTANSGTCITNGQSSTVATAIGTTGDFGKGIDNTNRLATAACISSHVHAAAQNAQNFGVARPAGASQWFLPTMYQWNLMVKAMCGKSTDLTTSTNNDYKGTGFNAKITAAGGRGVLSNSYWSSVEYSASSAWYMNFNYGRANYANKSSAYYVRAVFAF